MYMSEYTIILAKNIKSLANSIPVSNIIKKSIVFCKNDRITSEISNLLDTCNGNISKMVENGLKAFYVDNRAIDYFLHEIPIENVLNERNKYKFIVNDLSVNETLCIFDSKLSANNFVSKLDKFIYDIEGNIVSEKDYQIVKVKYIKD